MRFVPHYTLQNDSNSQVGAVYMEEGRMEFAPTSGVNRTDLIQLKNAILITYYLDVARSSASIADFARREIVAANFPILAIADIEYR